MNPKHAIAIVALASAQCLHAQIDAGKGASVASVVIDLQSGQTLQQNNADQLLTPASLTKLLTTAAAIDLIGAQHKIATQAFISANGKQLTIRGMCDPTMASAYFSWHSIEAFATSIANALKQQNATQIERISFDSGYISESPYSSKRLWEDMGNYYGAAPTSFCTNDNTVTYTFSSPIEPNKPCQLISTQPAEDINVQCFVKSYTKQADSVYIYGIGQNWYATGCMPCNRAKFNVRGAMANPQKIFEQKLLTELRQQGIKIANVADEKNCNYTSLKPLATDYSPSIVSIAKVTNHESVNLYADALMLHLCGEESTSVDRALQQLRQYVKRITGQEAILYDGSGLSPLNALSPHQIATVIRHIETSAQAQAFDKTLSIAGVSGTLKRLGVGTAIVNNVRGKSGSMSGVLAYAGIVNATNGKQYVFCIITNHSPLPPTELRQRIARWLTELMKL